MTKVQPFKRRSEMITFKTYQSIPQKQNIKIVKEKVRMDNLMGDTETFNIYTN